MLSSRIFIFIFALLSSAIQAAQVAHWGSDCKRNRTEPVVHSGIGEKQQIILDALASESLAVSYHLYDPTGNLDISVGRAIPFHAASTFKAGILMAAVYISQSEKKKSLREMVRVRNSFRSVVGRKIFSVPLGDKNLRQDKTPEYLDGEVPLYFLLQDMITNSSNLATNLVIEHYGRKKISRVLRNRFSLREFHLRRLLYDTPAHERCIDITVTPRTYTSMYPLIFSDFFSQESKQFLYETLSSPVHREGIPALLPSHFSVYFKPGNTGQIVADAGAVIPPDGKPYYFSAFIAYYKNKTEARNAIAQASLAACQMVAAARGNTFSCGATE